MEDTRKHSVLNVSQQPSMDPLEKSSPREPATGIRFLDLPYESHPTVYHYYIPHNYEISLDYNLHSCVGWRNNSTRIFGDPPYPFSSILLVSKQVSEESLDVLYGDDIFVYEWDIHDPRTSIVPKYSSYDGDCS